MGTKIETKMDTKEEILKIVDSLFAQKGYCLSMSEIANGVGIKVPSIYSHFSGKDEIIKLVTEKEILNFFTSVSEEMDKKNSKTNEEQIMELFYFILNYYKLENRLRFWKNMSLIQELDLKKRCGSLVREREKELFDRLCNVFKEGQIKKEIKETEIEGLVSLFFVIVRGVMDFMIVYNSEDFDLENYIDKIWKEYWNAVKK